MEDIYLFGAGQKGRYWLRCLKSFGVMPSGFIDNNPELAGSLVDGVQVYGAAHSKAFSSGYILVTCNDEEEICRQLLELEFPEEKIVHGLHNITNHILCGKSYTVHKFRKEHAEESFWPESTF